jgi:hypothetical protein
MDNVQIFYLRFSIPKTVIKNKNQEMFSVLYPLRESSSLTRSR